MKKKNIFGPPNRTPLPNTPHVLTRRQDVNQAGLRLPADGVDGPAGQRDQLGVGLGQVRHGAD